MPALIVANWKMNGSKDLLLKFCEELNVFYSRNNPPVLCGLLPPFPYLISAHELLYHPQCHTGGQDCAPFKSGAYTGDVSASMIRDCGGRYVVIGHSERRQRHAEGTETLVAKMICALQAELVPIFCFGESTEDAEAERGFEVCLKQIRDVFEHPSLQGVSMHHVVFAYEPIWAIGTGATPNPADVNKLLGRLDHYISENLSTISQYEYLYGGSVTADNLASFLSQNYIQGALVGGASLKAETFIPLLETAVARNSSD